MFMKLSKTSDVGVVKESLSAILATGVCFPGQANKQSLCGYICYMLIKDTRLQMSCWPKRMTASDHDRITR